ncbi:MAG TPA: TolC family protein, partial [Candidatus Deferrimicrobium sp.]|nr:TolC family protein [Candidatus Deferrimicrobium sp.]
MTVVGLVVAVVASPSAAVREVTLQQALNLALQHSHDLKAAQAHSKAYQATLGSARSARWPTASVTATAFYKTEVPSFDLTLPIINQTMRREIGTKENYQTDVRLTLPLFSGGRIGGQIEA